MSLQNESELEKAEEDILDKVQDCVYGLNLNVGGKEYKEILGQIKNSIWLRGEIQRVIKNILSQREQEIAEEVKKIKTAGHEECNDDFRMNVLSILNQ